LQQVVVRCLLNFLNFQDAAAAAGGGGGVYCSSWAT
jgi:hypothetical protein